MQLDEKKEQKQHKSPLTAQEVAAATGGRAAEVAAKVAAEITAKTMQEHRYSTKCWTCGLFVLAIIILLLLLANVYAVAHVVARLEDVHSVCRNSPLQGSQEHAYNEEL